MPIHKIPYRKTGYFSALINDYLEQSKKVAPFFHLFPTSAHFEKQANLKDGQFDRQARQRLVKSLMRQYGELPLSQATLANIDLLKETHTMTVTTGHQLNLFTGPLYFLYKILAVINLTESLKKSYPNYQFVPVYWMASEDHDFEEINFFNIYDDKIQWGREASGPVGRLSLEGLEDIKSSLKDIFGKGKNADYLMNLFDKAYTGQKNLAMATRSLANELFATYGLVIIDGDDSLLKEQFVPYMEKELIEQQAHPVISNTTEALTAKGYPEQVFPREINLFYIRDGIRERIIKRDNRFFIGDTQQVFSTSEIMEELKSHPERFSPNALMRPLYQEVVLPNICYIGGGGELAYWFQLKDYFELAGVPFPILLLRNSILLASQRQIEKLSSMQVPVDELFLKRHELMTRHTHRISDIEIDFSKQRSFLKEQFKSLYELAEKTDASFVGAVAAQEKKQLNGLDKLEKRLLKAQKRKLADQLERLTILQQTLFPGESLQERNRNFSEFYLQYGERLIPALKEAIDPLDLRFTILEL